jgi:hypothetical protein
MPFFVQLETKCADSDRPWMDLRCQRIHRCFTAAPHWGCQINRALSLFSRQMPDSLATTNNAAHTGFPVARKRWLGSRPKQVTDAASHKWAAESPPQPQPPQPFLSWRSMNQPLRWAGSPSPNCRAKLGKILCRGGKEERLCSWALTTPCLCSRD